MKVQMSKFKLLLAGVSCAVIAACSDSSISSPGEGQLPTPPAPTNPNPPTPPSTTVDARPAGGCPTGFSSITQTLGSVELTACQTSGTLLADTVLPGASATTGQGAIYFLNGQVSVGTDAGGDAANPLTGSTSVSLTIGAGASVVGGSTADYLTVARGSQLIVDGEQFNPVVFTSADDLEATLSDSPRGFDDGANAEWGGLIINGRAPINACDDPAAIGGAADCEKAGEGNSGLFGGNSATDNSGRLNYMQVRYAGAEVTADNELNGIAFQGVGSGTEVDYVQVHNNFDDGVEFFGGTVNVKHLVLTQIGDDSMDYTDGWTGNAQFVLVQQGALDGSRSGDQGFEFDNFEDDDDRQPRSNPTISNFTLIGTQDTGMLLREGTAGDLMNGIVTGFPDEACLDIDDSSSHAQADAGALTLNSTFFSCTNANFRQDDTPSFSEEDFFNGVAPYTANQNNVEGTSSLVGTFFPGSNEQGVTATDPTTAALVDADRRAFFDSVDYIGAFSPNESAGNSWATGWTFGLFPEVTECPTGTVDSGESIGDQFVCRITGTIDRDVRLVAGPLYELVGAVFVGIDAGADAANPNANALEATLTIDPGVTVFGRSTADYLVVSRGSQLQSNGSRGAPVIMTSRADILAAAAGNDRGYNTGNNAEWGGLIINGRAPINACDDPAAVGGTVDCEKAGEGSSGLFGGADASDNSGSIRYTRVQYAGAEVTADNELNGIAFQGVGNGTTVEYVQVHNNFDDGVEFFGGTVNVKNLLLTQIGDDSMDYTDGWTGNAQFVLVVQGDLDGSRSGDQGFEFDNFEDDDDRAPRSNPTISNFTLVGSQDTGMLLREGTAGDLMNGIVIGFPDEACLDVDDNSSHNQAAAGELTLRSTFFDCATDFSGDSDGFSEEDFFNGVAPYTANVNNVAGSTTVTQVFVPGSAEQAVTVIDPTTDALVDADRRAFFDSVTYIGAVENASDERFKGWTLLPAGAPN